MRGSFNMKKTGFRRFDIFLADLRQFNIEEPHYVLILSNYKCNIKSPEVNAVMITSKLRKLPSHVDFEGFGLLEKSEVKCEKIFTLQKLTQLIKKVGNISDIGLQIKIENALAQQLQLNVNYNNFNAFDLENLFVDNNKTENDKVKLEELKSELFVCYRDKKYKKSIELAKNLKAVSTELKYGDKQYIWYSYYMISLSNLALNNVEESFENVKICLSYITKPSSYSKDYGISLWLFANILEEMKDNKRCLKIYTSLIRYYKNNNETMMRIANLYSVAYVKRNRKAIINIYNILEKVIPTNRSIYNNNEYKNNLLSEIKEGLTTF